MSSRKVKTDQAFLDSYFYLDHLVGLLPSSFYQNEASFTVAYQPPKLAEAKDYILQGGFVLRSAEINGVFYPLILVWLYF